MPKGTAEDYPRNFFSDLKDCNIGMYVTNNSLTPDPELEPSQLTSRPIDWFWMKQGIRMSSWAEDATRFFMLGNPFVWWISSVSIIFNCSVFIAAVLFKIRRYSGQGAGALRNMIIGPICKIVQDERKFMWGFRLTFGGWLLTYLPFFAMGRVTYVHHYYPSLVVAILSTALMLDTILANNFASDVVLAALGLTSIAAFYVYKQFAYGMTGPLADYAKLQLLSSWSIVNQSEYD